MADATELVIYHNPRCGKSRAALALLTEFRRGHAVVGSAAGAAHVYSLRIRFRRALLSGVDVSRDIRLCASRWATTSERWSR